jgi:hypothetical protein
LQFLVIYDALDTNKDGTNPVAAIPPFSLLFFFGDHLLPHPACPAFPTNSADSNTIYTNNKERVL